MAHGRGFPLVCQAERCCFWGGPHRRNPNPEMFFLSPCAGFQQVLGSPGMALFTFITRSPAPTMHTVHSEPGWCKLPLNHEEGAQLLPELLLLLPAGWLE